MECALGDIEFISDIIIPRAIGGMREKHPDWFKEDLAALFDLLAADKLKPAIERHMRLEDAAEAHRLIEDAAVKGRIVLTVSE